MSKPITLLFSYILDSHSLSLFLSLLGLYLYLFHVLSLRSAKYTTMFTGNGIKIFSGAYPLAISIASFVSASIAGTSHPELAEIIARR